MSNIEPRIKAQYAKFFQADDWTVFRQLAEHYLEVAVHLKMKDIVADEAYKLWLRNVQKRLFIGVGCELLLKSHYLHQGYGINTPKRKQPWHLYRIQDVNPNDYDSGNTYSMNFLLDQLENGPCFAQQAAIECGFRIAKVFRNKEGHIAVYWHNYDPQNYTDIEVALKAFYREALGEVLDVQFSFEGNEPAEFRIR
jgi:hypothetical protein